MPSALSELEMLCRLDAKRHESNWAKYFFITSYSVQCHSCVSLLPWSTTSASIYFFASVDWGLQFCCACEHCFWPNSDRSNFFLGGCSQPGDLKVLPEEQDRSCVGYLRWNECSLLGLLHEEALTIRMFRLVVRRLFKRLTHVAGPGFTSWTSASKRFGKPIKSRKTS